MKDLRVIIKHSLLILGMYVVLATIAAFISPEQVGISMTAETMKYHQFLLFASILTWGSYYLQNRKIKQ